MGIIKVTVQGHTPGETFTTGMYVDNPGGDASGAAAAFVTAFTTFWNAVKAFVPTTIGVDAIDAVEVDPLTFRNGAGATTGVALVGTDAADPLPPQTALVVSLKTAIRTRAGRGRMYLPPFGTDQIDAGRVPAATVTAVKNAAAALVNDLQATGYTPVIYHRGPHTTDVINQVIVGDVYDTQRRRRNKLVEARSSVGV